MFGRLGGCESDSPQAEQFEQRRGLSVEGTQLPLGPGQVDAAETGEGRRGERKKEQSSGSEESGLTQEGQTF